MQRILYETHSHTPLCRHATGTPKEYAAVAYQRGLRGMIVTCHNPMPDGFSAAVRMREDEFQEYVDLVAEAREFWLDRVDVRLGLEADYFAGYESYLQNQLDSAEFHYVLGSVHPQIPEFRERYWQDDLVSVQRTYFRLLADAAETGLFDCLAHPDLIKNQTSLVWDPPIVMDDIRRSLDRIADTGTAMELNTSGVNKVIAEMNPFPQMLVEMRQRDIPVVVGADAHVPERVSDGFLDALDLLHECGYRQVSLFLNRTRQEVTISEARESLRHSLDIVE
ncbi:MAG: histidinol-phosphatase [Planctomycetaceae bacterium]|nr:histidinol-phosphatase [Planctomycetaceae bacterium]